MVIVSCLCQWTQCWPEYVLSVCSESPTLLLAFEGAKVKTPSLLLGTFPGRRDNTDDLHIRINARSVVKITNIMTACFKK